MRWRRARPQRHTSSSRSSRPTAARRFSRGAAWVVVGSHGAEQRAPRFPALALGMQVKYR